MMQGDSRCSWLVIIIYSYTYGAENNLCKSISKVEQSVDCKIFLSKIYCSMNPISVQNSLTSG